MSTKRSYERHGMTGTAIHNAWRHMKGRCSNPKIRNFHNYGGRGIRVCERWLSFANFYEDMAVGHFEGASIDRIDNDGNYEPGNCRWATPKEQGRNRRTNRTVTYRGKTMTLIEAIESSGKTSALVNNRLSRGWTLTRALEEPLFFRGQAL